MPCAFSRVADASEILLLPQVLLLEFMLIWACIFAGPFQAFVSETRVLSVCCPGTLLLFRSVVLMCLLFQMPSFLTF